MGLSILQLFPDKTSKAILIARVQKHTLLSGGFSEQILFPETRSHDLSQCTLSVVKYCSFASILFLLLLTKRKIDFLPLMCCAHMVCGHVWIAKEGASTAVSNAIHLMLFYTLLPPWRAQNTDTRLKVELKKQNRCNLN